MRILRWIGSIAGVLVALILVALGALYLLSQRRIGRHYAVAGHEVPVATDSATLAWGAHIVVTRGCTGCHGEGLEGAEFVNVPIVAHLHTANLTRGAGGVAADYHTSADWERAIRQGVAPDGRALLFMPSQEFYEMSDRDLGALVAWIQSRPAVDRQFGAQAVGPVGRALFLAGKLPLLPAELVDHDAPRPEAPVVGVTAAYGGYLATTCRGCHGAGFSGGPIPGAPPEMLAPRNITPDSATGIGRWTETDFAKAVRTGMRPDGTKLNEAMPSQQLAVFSDDEIAAIWMYLRTLPAKVYGGR
jgi:cytochrome c553